MSIKNVDQIPVSRIFPNDSTVIYKIPKYQREYIWGKYDWDALFTDVVDNEQGYFLGAYICVSTGSLGISTLELIDGQQRFVTLSILLMALYKKLCDYRDNEEIDENDKLTSDELTDLNNLHYQLANKISEKVNGKKTTRFEQRLILQVQNNNQDDFRFLLGACGVLEAVSNKPHKAGNRRIVKAFRYFCDKIDEFVDENIKEGNFSTEAEALFHLVEQFGSAILVGIEVDTHQDAYMLFESLNNRGVPLSAIDLIKNILIATADKNGLSADDCYDKWKVILENITDDYSVQERFFRQYYNAFRDELNEPFKEIDKSKKYPLGPLATRTTLLNIYEKLIKNDLIKFIKEVLLESKYYSIIVNNCDEDKLYNPQMLSLERVQGAPGYLLLLYLLTYQKPMKLTDQNIVSIVDILVKFFIRRNITDIPNTRKLTKLFMDIINAIKNMRSGVVVATIKQKLMEVSASDEDFEDCLYGPLYDENYDACRFVLCALEEKHQTRENISDLWERDNYGKYIWTIEHIFPEGEKIPKDWINMIADGSKELAEEYQEEYVHTLGNLTITGYNPSLSNFSFEKKKNRKSRDGSRYIGYRNGLYLNDDVVKQDKWTVDIIEKRTDKLVDEIITLFSW